ncbi:MAG: hypothetical protein PHP37_03645, partial [Patescibacteria group bacterium]|nr:hypothetical protein [Patescibacteria group bacterium]
MVGAIVAIALAIKIALAIVNWIESLIAGGSTRHASRSVEAISGPRPEAIGHKLEAIHMPPANRPRRQLTAYERDQLEPVSLGRRISDWWKRVNRLPSVYAMRSLRRKNRRNRVRESGGLNYDYRLQAGEHGTDLLPAPAANPARLMNALLVVLAQETLLGRVASAALDKESDVDGSIETYGAANFVFDLESMSLDQGKKNQALVPGTYWLRVIPLARGQKPVYVAELVILPPDPGGQDDDLGIELLRPAADNTDDNTTEAQAPVPD